MENIFFNDQFYSDFNDLCEHNEWDKDEIESFPEDFTIEVYECTLEPIEQISSAWITERMDEERFSELRCDEETTAICKILDEHIDFDKINSLIPKLYYPKTKKTIVTKQQLLELV